LPIRAGENLRLPWMMIYFLTFAQPACMVSNA